MNDRRATISMARMGVIQTLDWPCRDRGIKYFRIDERSSQ